MKKKLISIVSIILVLALAVSCAAVFAGCGEKDNGVKDTEVKEITMPAYSGIKAQTVENADSIPSSFKIGLICLHGMSSTYDANFIKAMQSVQKDLGLSNSQVIIREGIPEGEDCYNTAIDLADEGCSIIIADSFGHEEYMIRAAKEKKDVLFAHATGTQACIENLPNYVNAFASIYEGRYLAGVVAGLKLKEMIDKGETVNGVKVTAETAKVGYVGAFTYAEVVSGYTSWFLGVRSIVPTATMSVTFTGSWYNETWEKNAANKLINQEKCVLISQHADSWGAPNACEDAGVPNVSYNGSTFSKCPNTFLVSSRINWAPYYKYLIDCKLNNKEVKKDYVGTLETGSVEMSNLGGNVAEGTLAKIVELREKLAKGEIKVFDTSKFTVGGKTVTTFTDNGQEVVKDGVFCESSVRSAPCFSLQIDGIKLLDTVFSEADSTYKD